MTALNRLESAIDGATKGKEKKLYSQAINLEDFHIMKVIGRGTFGKVYMVKKKDTNEIYAMKVLKKSVLVKNKHLKYAITECNVLKWADHPYIIKMHYSF